MTPNRRRRSTLWIYAAMTSGARVTDVAHETGISQQAIWRLLDRNWPGWRDERRQAVAKLKQQKWEREHETVPCAICQKPFERRVAPKMPRRTCSEECAKLLDDTTVRYHLDEKRHNNQVLYNARYVLKHKEKFSIYKIRWARRVLTNSVKEAHGRWRVGTSPAVEAAAAKGGPMPPRARPSRKRSS